jgi:acetyl-CoA carboxylase biotin carboxyl carrier protein
LIDDLPPRAGALENGGLLGPRAAAPRASSGRAKDRTKRRHSKSGKRMAKVEVKADVTGCIWKVEVSAGQTVAAGDTLIVIESMKMEIPVFTEVAGAVGSILVAEADYVNEGQPLIVIET